MKEHSNMNHYTVLMMRLRTTNCAARRRTIFFSPWQHATGPVFVQASMHSRSVACFYRICSGGSHLGTGGRWFESSIVAFPKQCIRNCFRPPFRKYATTRVQLLAETHETCTQAEDDHMKIGITVRSNMWKAVAEPEVCQVSRLGAQGLPALLCR